MKFYCRVVHSVKTSFAVYAILPYFLFMGQKCINALNKHWHQDHFFCSHCGKPFPPGAGFLEHDGKAYCEEDFFSMFAPMVYYGLRIFLL
jgi:hypothetical protein